MVILHGKRALNIEMDIYFGTPKIEIRSNNLGRREYFSREEVVEILREQLRTTYKSMVDTAYSSPYPNYIDHLYEFTRNFKFPTFTLFSGEDQIYTRKHIGRFTTQCRQVATYDFLKLRLFSSSLIESAFEWYINLPQNLIRTWQEMEKVFHAQFYSAKTEFTLVDLTKMYQV